MNGREDSPRSTGLVTPVVAPSPSAAVGGGAAELRAAGAFTPIALDARNTRITFGVRLGSYMVRGHFGAMHGELRLAGERIDAASIVLDVAAESIETGVPMRDRHLRGQSFLDTARFPVISFRSQRIARRADTLEVGGILSLRGREQHVIARCELPAGVDARQPELRVLGGVLQVSRIEYGVGVPTGLDRINPIFLIVGRQVQLRIDVTVPTSSWAVPFPVPSR
ncbi:MAG: YceI family protein [Gemmatimonadaceae bacterium]